MKLNKWRARFRLWSRRQWLLWLRTKVQKPLCYCDLSGEPTWRDICEVCQRHNEEEEMSKETYLGDGVYASWDGYQIKLRTPREEGDHIIYLDPDVILALTMFMEKIAVQ